MDSDDEPITNFERDQMVRIVAQNVSSKADGIFIPLIIFIN